MRFERSRPLASSWIPGVWVLVGGELLVLLYFHSLGPPRSREAVLLSHHAHAEALLELAGATAVVNLLIVVGLWARTRGGEWLGESRRVRRFGAMMAAGALALAPWGFLELGKIAQPPEQVVRVVWERVDGDYYRMSSVGP